MNLHHRLRAWQIAAILLNCSPVWAEVAVQTTDGRTLAGEVDADTDADRLWIRHESERIVLTSSVRWSEISTATIDGQPVAVDELADRAASLATDAPKEFFHHIARPSWPATETARPSWPATETARPSCPATELARPSWPVVDMSRPRWPGYVGCVASLEIDAVLVNRDRDVEPDGLELVVAALDPYGAPVPVRGNIYARLWAERDWPNASVDRFEDVQRWSQPVCTQDFVDGVARYYLRFRTLHPEFDWTLNSEAVLNVRLGVYGQGNYEASVPVHLRHFNPIRDRLQLTEGSRFFRNELTEAVRYE